MSRKEEIEERSWKLLGKACEEAGCVPVDAEYAKNGGEWELLYYIDKEGGVTVEDCEKVSRAVEKDLDAEDFIPDAYTLFVSSPGLTRPIRRPRDFIFAKGREVEGKFYKPVGGKKEFSGVLKDFSEGTVVIEGEDGEAEINKKDIASMNLSFS